MGESITLKVKEDYSYITQLVDISDDSVERIADAVEKRMSKKLFSNYIAWMPLPDAYKGEGEQNDSENNDS